MSDVLKVQDSDTGESHLDVVRVPEGFSLQMSMNGGQPMPEDFVSVIVSPADALEMIGFFAETPSPPERPAATDYGCPRCNADAVLSDATDRFGICAVCGWFGLNQTDEEAEAEAADANVVDDHCDICGEFESECTCDDEDES